MVARPPVQVQQAISASGWKIDSAENLIAPPANLATSVLPPNPTDLPSHSGSHGVLYDSDVRAALQPLIARAMALAPPALKAAMNAVATRFRGALVTDRRYHSRLA